ncbi:MAG: hypothetical protein VX640_14280 [Pseudomonadota bacterium]|nr:hypothetical protein [Pseudomonadota bacterium]
MPRYVANAVPSGKFVAAPSPAVYRVARRRSSPGAAVFGPLGFLKDLAQGAGAGALTFLGAMKLSAGAAPLTLETVMHRVMQGGAPGAIEIAGAAALFLSAGKGPGRVLGLLAFIVLVSVYANGAESAEVVAYIENLYAKLSQILSNFGAAGLIAA